MLPILCATCHYRLSEASSRPDKNVKLLLCTNCGRVYSCSIVNGLPVYRYVGMTQGNNEVREILNLKEDKS